MPPAPRPNQIGLSVVPLDKIEDGLLVFRNPDMIDGTPLLDIKPYVPEFDSHPAARAGWLEELPEEVRHKRSDGRFR